MKALSAAGGSRAQTIGGMAQVHKVQARAVVEDALACDVVNV